jgi:hypothetical protein
LRCARRRAGEGLIAGCLSLLTRSAYSHKSRARANLRGDAVPRAVPYQGTAGRPSGPPVKADQQRRDACHLFAQLERAGGRLVATFRLNELSGALITRTYTQVRAMSGRGPGLKPHRNGTGLSATPVAGIRRIDSQPRQLERFGTRLWKVITEGRTRDGGGSQAKMRRCNEVTNGPTLDPGRVGRAWALIAARRT